MSPLICTTVSSRCYRARTVSWHEPMPRAFRKAKTLRCAGGHRMPLLTAGRMLAGPVLVLR